MDKHVFSASALRLNKSVPFLRIEPLHSAACHCQISKLTIKDSVPNVRCQFLPPRRTDRLPCRRGSQRDRRAHKVAFADLDTAVAQEIVGGRVMYMEISEAAVRQQACTAEVCVGA